MSLILNNDSIRTEDLNRRIIKKTINTGVGRKVLNNISNSERIHINKRDENLGNLSKGELITKNISKLEITTIITRSKSKILHTRNSTCNVTVRNLLRSEQNITKINCENLINKKQNKKIINFDNEIEEPYKKFKGDDFPCLDYVKDIYIHLLKKENDFLITKNFLKNSKISPQMRSILIDWMIDVQVMYKISNESLHLSVYLLDSYLENNKTLGKETLQLVGISCIFISCKYDLIHSPHLKDFVQATNNTCKKSDILKMEIEILKNINMNLNKPQIMCFVRRYSIISGTDKLDHCLSKFLADACLINYNTCHYKSSLIAAASTFISLCIKYQNVSPSIWNHDLIKYSNYEIYDFFPIIRSLSNFIIDLPQKKYSTGITEKYSLLIFEKVIDKIYEPNNIELLTKFKPKM